MNGYTDQEWASAVARDWQKPDVPVSLDDAVNLRGRLNRSDITLRIVTAVNYFNVGLSVRVDTVDKLSLSKP